MKVIIAGGSGQIGTILARAFHGDGHDVVVLSRQPRSAPWRAAVWDAQTLGRWVEELENAAVVVNLAGRSVNCRYNANNCRAIKQSRLDSTRVIGQAIAQARHPPRLWLQASTATIYAHRYDSANNETSGGHSYRPTGTGLAAGNRRRVSAKRNRVDPQESSRGSCSIVAKRFPVRVSELARCGAGSVPPLAREVLLTRLWDSEQTQSSTLARLVGPASRRKNLTR